MRALVVDRSVGDLLDEDKKKPLLASNGTELVPEMLAKMAAAHVLSVPVIENGKLRGIFDVLDYVALVLGDGPVASLAVAKARNASRHDVCLTVSRSDGLFSLAEIFSRGVHRVCVVDGGVVVGVVSQSSLLSFLARHLPPPEKGSILDQTLEEAHLVHPSAHVDSEQSLRAALALMNDSAYEAIAVTTKDGALLGAVQVSLLRGLGPDELHAVMEKSVGDFALAHKEKLVRSVPSATVRDTICTVASARAHQTWLEQEGKLKGIVTLSDLVRIAMKGLAGHHHKK